MAVNNRRNEVHLVPEAATVVPTQIFGGLNSVDINRT